MRQGCAFHTNFVVSVSPNIALFFGSFRHYFFVRPDLDGSICLLISENKLLINANDRELTILTSPEVKKNASTK